MELTAVEARVLGALLEKQLATPQYFPLTLNSLVLACNQSTNRDPVTAYTEADVQQALDGLRAAGLARVVHASGTRAPKYRHVLDEAWHLDDAHRAALAVLLLRGPQTAAEIRARTERLVTWPNATEVESILGLLAARETPLVVQRPRVPGQKEARFVHLLSGPTPPPSPAEVSGDGVSAHVQAGADAGAARDDTAGGWAGRLSRLEEQVVELRAQVEAMRREIRHARPPSTD